MDMVGYGRNKSERPECQYSFAQQVDTLVNFILNKVERNSKLVLVGRSWGGGLVLQAASKLVDSNPSLNGKKNHY